MSEDRSLDDFAPDAGTEAGADGSEAAVDDGSNAAVDGDVDRVDPASPTSTWHADGADCDRCGERVERCWRDGDALVCADCAPW
ncbi:hypothetical protein ABNG02_02240 [Halorubrum ejinorense]|uniref:DUF7573 domain-containing protein n=1 Tax=Halorubrum ejinorense TaxID=425309 RepID=A0AAV3SNA3_9EURY